MRLRRGEFAVEAYLDLHGMTQPDSKLALQEFIRALGAQGPSHRAGRPRPRLGFPGRTAGAQARHRTMAVAWNAVGLRVGFCNRAPTDGGAGALYVLLRRDRRRAAFDVLNGAKRRE